ncbi:hypothetical protein TNCV_4805831 [Trichonephila clavipes]|nr:hypothetical protein TNCV_4805831 [Trichonephila clavipes]
MRCGKGAESARVFCEYHESSPATHKILKVQPHFTAATKIWQRLFVKPLMKMMEKRDLAVAVDGSQKRGFSSKNGLVTVTSVDTGKVIDVEVFFKTLFCPDKTKHLQNYTWCKFKKAELLEETYHHKKIVLPVDVVEAMRPVFSLANPELLKKSVYMGFRMGQTSSVNSLALRTVSRKYRVYTVRVGVWEKFANPRDVSNGTLDGTGRRG